MLISDYVMHSSMHTVTFYGAHSTHALLGHRFAIIFGITFMCLADALIQSDLQCIQVIHFLSVCVFPGSRTHNLSAANAMLYH